MKKHITLILILPLLVLHAFAGGTIQIEAEPGLKVYLDDEFQGVTDKSVDGIILQNVSAGSHAIRTSKQGFRDQEKTVLIEENEVEFVQISPSVPEIEITQEGEIGNDVSEALTGTLKIQTIPLNTVIEIPKIGITKNSKQSKKMRDIWNANKLPVGEYEITVSFKDKSSNFVATIVSEETSHYFINILTGEIKNISADRNADENHSHDSSSDKEDSNTPTTAPSIDSEVLHKLIISRIRTLSADIETDLEFFTDHLTLNECTYPYVSDWHNISFISSLEIFTENEVRTYENGTLSTIVTPEKYVIILDGNESSTPDGGSLWKKLGTYSTRMMKSYPEHYDPAGALKTPIKRELYGINFTIGTMTNNTSGPLKITRPYDKKYVSELYGCLSYLLGVNQNSKKTKAIINDVEKYHFSSVNDAYDFLVNNNLVEDIEKDYVDFGGFGGKLPPYPLAESWKGVSMVEDSSCYLPGGDTSCLALNSKLMDNSMMNGGVTDPNFTSFMQKIQAALEMIRDQSLWE